MSIKILLAGGGSGGPVAPLLAVAGAIKKNNPDAQFILVGTKKGPERIMAEDARINYSYIISSKWRRYFSLKNVATPILILIGLFQSLVILRKFKPDCVFGAGSFVQVPVIWAAWVLGIPSVIHQQDLMPSLANKLCQAFAKKITVCFEQSLTDFKQGLGIFYASNKFQKVIQTGNPVRQELAGMARETAVKELKLRSDMPVLLVLGGGTGSDFINQLMIDSVPTLSKTIQIIHSWGMRNPQKMQYNNYYPHGFITNMTSAYAAADIVLSRAGLSTLAELSNLGKVSIIIPMPGTHQEYNSDLLKELKSALVLEQQRLNTERLLLVIKKLIFDLSLQQTLSRNILKIMPKNSAEKIGKIIIEIALEHAK
ncbi:MAG: UDP-N-acetylglucosamine--N-acetylmuramyl-(pentapeptide) pyrophosphoryl-undecaprenol N-acetylglucosamine transferase [Patescibacteria group bacterium]